MQFCGQHDVHLANTASRDPDAVDVCLWPTPFISGQLDGCLAGIGAQYYVISSPGPDSAEI